MINQINDYLDPVIQLAVKAGEAILAIYQTPAKIEVSMKPDRSPLTQADFVADELIHKGLKKITSAFPILSEESEHPEFDVRQQWETYWLVDPLDATREFIRRSGEFSINIALIHQKKPILGVVYMPVYQLVYYAVTGGGAFKRENNFPSERIQVRPWRKKKTVIVGGRQFPTKKLTELFDEDVAYMLKAKGSAWKICMVAEGTADLYVRYGATSEWDTAAGQCILEEAGGALVTLDLEPLYYNIKSSLINPYFLALGDSKVLINYFSKYWEKKNDVRKSS